MNRRNIILVGFMGTGKSTCGRLAAERLGYTFLDMDEEIEKRAGKGIPRIFAEDGEPHFRELERRLVQELAARDQLVVAAGGGVVLDADNLRDFSRTGVVICLKADPGTILARVEKATHRPLLEDGEKAHRIRSLLAQRQPLYDAIPNQLDTTAPAPGAVVEQILRLLEETG